MADHLKPTITSTYSNFVTELDARFDDLAVGLDPAVSSPTNVFINSIRWSSASNKWQKYNGSTWADLSSLYSINISGNAGTVTNGVVTTGSYSNPTWITALAGSKITGDIAGNAATATILATSRNINGVAFNGSTAISVNLNNSVTFNNAGSGGVSGTAFNGGTATTVSYNSVGAPSVTGANASGTWDISISGNAATATSATSATSATTATTATTVSNNAITPEKLVNSGYELGFRNKIINGNFSINQRSVSGTVTLSAKQYAHDRWRAGDSGCTYTYSKVNNITTLTITSGSLVQVIEGENLLSGTYVLSWTGTAQGKIGAGAYSSSGVTSSVTGGSNLRIEFSTGTISLVQFERGSVPTPFEFKLISTEENICYRYYYKDDPNDSRVLSIRATSNGSWTTSCWASIRYPVKMRAVPSVSFTASGYTDGGIINSTVLGFVANGTITSSVGGVIYSLVANAEITTD